VIGTHERENQGSREKGTERKREEWQTVRDTDKETNGDRSRDTEASPFSFNLHK